MSKRGQATIFIILGLVILAVLLLVFMLRGAIPFIPVSQESLESNLGDIENHIQDCLKESGEKYLWIIAKQGGYIKTPEATYRNYFNSKEANPISYLCYNIPNQVACQNRMLTKTHMEQELQEFILQDASDCLQDIPVKSRYKTQILSAPKLNIKIGQDSTALLLEYPVTLTYDELQASRNKFIINIQLPLGRLYDTATAIVNSEALIGDFETLVYSVKKTEFTGKQYIVQKLQPYPDKLYLIKINNIPAENKEYTLQFFIQGEDRFES